MVPREAIYKGATRPAMKFGIPLVPLVVMAAAAMLLMLWGGIFVSGWIAVAGAAACAPGLAWMRFVTRRDDQRLRQLFLAVKLRFFDRNRRHWGSSSYAPHPYRGSREAWHV